jgi:hypothetical protein
LKVILYDQFKSWSPSINRTGDSGRGVGGWECLMVQLASGLASAGYEVQAVRRGAYELTDGVRYLNAQDNMGQMQCDVLVTGRQSQIPTWIKAERTFTACVDDPTTEPHAYAHLKKRSVMVHLSQWQRLLYEALVHTGGVVIPSMIDDWIYELPREPKNGWVCVNAWNKGTVETLKMWEHLKNSGFEGQLSVGSPYGFPADAYDQCQRVGARWLGLLTPRKVVGVLNRAEAVFRVCRAPETFGVTDAIAEVVGTRVHCLCTNGFGASKEALTSPFVTDSATAFIANMSRSYTVTRVNDYSVSHVMPMWLEALGLS